MDRIRKNKKGEISISDLDITMFVILGILVFLSCILFSSVISYEKEENRVIRQDIKNVEMPTMSILMNLCE